MWTYEQSTGRLLKGDVFAVRGYSGYMDGHNNPGMQDVRGIGPVPQGDYDILEAVEMVTDHGPYVLRLRPCAGTNTFGRDGFLMHGDSKEHPGLASHGCIILPFAVRELVHNSGDRLLRVVSGVV